MIRIIAIRVIDRIKESGHTQVVLSKYAGIIKSRLGFHELSDDVCSREAYILLHLKNDEAAVNKLMSDLNGIYGIEMKHMHLGAEADKPLAIPADSAVAVMGLIVSNRSDTISNVQKTLSSFGCTIKTRLGINEEEHGENVGLILMELIGENKQMNGLLNRLSDIDDISLGVISFN